MFTLSLALGLALATPTAHAGKKKEAAAAAAPSKAHGAIQGSWRLLGPASTAYLPLMLEFTFQDTEPTDAEMSAVFLTQEQQKQVWAARVQAAANPRDPQLMEMQATFAAMDAAQIEITAGEIIAISPDSREPMPYTIKAEDGITLTVATQEPGGTTSDLMFTLPAPGLLMMGPQGAEPLVLRRR